VVFDPATIGDMATFDAPHTYPVGIGWVIVNGEVTAENGTMTDARAGKVIYGPGKE
jgi:N-acyl-D-aspartate/D-glutamate deacylase